MGGAEVAVTALTGGLGFVLTDGLDRLLATYNPAATEKPKDKFTSDGAGTLANALNVAAPPSFARLATSAVATAVPAVGAAVVEDAMGRAALQGAALGAGIKLFSMVWDAVLMPLLAPKDTTPAALQKSFVARLYPAEVAATINMHATPPMTSVASSASGALSDYPQLGTGEVGPFALAAGSEYPDAAEALRRQAGVSDYPTAAQALYRQAGTIGEIVNAAAPGVHPTTAAQAGAAIAETPHDIGGALVRSGFHPAHAAALVPHVAYQVLLLLEPAHARPAAGVGEGWQPGPPSDVGPGPQAKPHTDPACGCVGDPTVGYSAFLGDARPADMMPAPNLFGSSSFIGMG